MPERESYLAAEFSGGERLNPKKKEFTAGEGGDSREREQSIRTAHEKTRELARGTMKHRIVSFRAKGDNTLRTIFWTSPKGSTRGCKVFGGAPST